MKFSYPLTDNERDLQRSVMALREEFEIVENASEYWKEQFEMLWNEVNEHGVLADVLQKWDGESDELDKLNRI